MSREFFRAGRFSLLIIWLIQTSSAWSAECGPSASALGVADCCPVLPLGFDGTAWVEKYPVLVIVVGLVFITATTLTFLIARSRAGDHDV